jgi:protein-S-isoprenylcysteine O-methyltransferase Ste14
MGNVGLMPAPATDAEVRQRAFRGLALFLATLATLVFLPAWSLTYWQGLVYWLVFAGSCIAITLNLMAKDPDLLRRRIQAGAAAETEPTQKMIQAIASVAFIATIIVPPLDHLFGWSYVPAVLSIVADALAALGFYGVFLTFRENSFAAATIQVETEQRVISTGPYAVVRHPMYATAGVMILVTPLALGSWWGLVPAVLLGAGVVMRLLDEERFLVTNLSGYADYQRRTRYRLVPGIW